MFIFTCIFILILPILTIECYGGDGDREGGDMLYCSKSDKSRYDGPYALDYILTRENHKSENSGSYSFPQEINRCDKYLDLIQSKLKKHIPVLAAGLELFLRSFKNKNYGSRNWFYAPQNSLINIRDEQIKRLIPKNCSDSKIVQLITRTQWGNVIYYDIDIENFNILSSKNPEQCSYMLLHEWARDFIIDANRINRFVAYLHSNDFFSASNGVAEKIRSLGTFIDINPNQVACITANPIDELVAPEAYKKVVDQYVARWASDNSTDERSETVRRISSFADRLTDVLRVSVNDDLAHQKLQNFIDSDSSYKTCTDPPFLTSRKTRKDACDETYEKVTLLRRMGGGIDAEKYKTIKETLIPEMDKYIASIKNKKLREKAFEVSKRIVDEHAKIHLERQQYIANREIEISNICDKMNTGSSIKCLMQEYMDLITSIKKIANENIKTVTSDTDNALLEIRYLNINE